MFSRKLLGLSLLAGLVPVGIQIALWLGPEPSEATLRSALTAAAIAVGVLVVLVRVLPGRLVFRTAQAIDELRAVTDRVAENDFRARVEASGPGRELRELGTQIDDLIQDHKRRVLNQKLEVSEAAKLRSASRQLIEECIYAREPLAKKHPGLAAAYAEAAIRNSGQERTADATVDALVHGVDTATAHKGNRENLRWTLEDVTVEVPVPSKLINMSITGMAVESNRGLPVGGSWVFRVGNGAFAYDIPGRVRWCKLDRTVKIADEVQPIFRTGVAFDEKLTGGAFDFFSPAKVAGAHAATS